LTSRNELEAILKWNGPDYDELRKYLVAVKGFTASRVEGGIKKLSELIKI